MEMNAEAQVRQMHIGLSPRNTRRIDGWFDATQQHCYHQFAGWSSLVARWAHNPKVGGSNPPPATKPPGGSLLQVPEIVKVASRAVCMDFLVCSRVLVPCSKTWNNLEQLAKNRLL